MDTSDPDYLDPQRRVLIHLPDTDVAGRIVALLEHVTIPCRLCASLREIAAGIADGAGAVLLSEDAQDDTGWNALTMAIDEQPPWSDLPILLCAGPGRMPRSGRRLERLAQLGNVTLLGRSLRGAALVSTVQFALRSRARQYELRDVLTALNDANRMKDEFLATLSHELRTPLNAILGWASMLRHAQVDPAMLPRAYEIIERNANAQRALIEDLLDMSRIITGTLTLTTTTAPVVPLLMAALDTMSHAAATKHVELRTEIEAPDAAVTADPARIEQIFWNLLSNAVKFTPEGGHVVARVFVRARQVFITVTDSGIGIDPEFIPFVFERFRQADPSTTRRFSGLGLGLSIVRHLVDLHGGQISVSSTGAGSGTMFRLGFPLAIPAAGDGAQGDLLPASTENLEGVRVLVVDEDRDSRELVAAILRSAGASVAHVAGSDRALAVLTEDPMPNVVISDIGMPGRNGYALVKAMGAEARPAIRDLPVIALTAYGLPHESEAALPNVHAILTKPIEPARLTRSVGEAVRRAPRAEAQ